MIRRSILSALFAIGIGTAALAEVGVQLKTPEGRADVELDVDVGKVKPTDAWIGRPVYSSDGKHLGEVSGIAGDQVYIDIGGFLGLGETRVLVDHDRIHEVTDDRIKLNLSEAETNGLPAADTSAVPPPQ